MWVVRHGCAGDKRLWPGPDEERPLDRAGMEQAEALAAALAEVEVCRIASSPTRRCRDTMAPLARAVGLVIEDLDALSLTATGTALVGLISDRRNAGGVLCTHGENMTAALGILRARGVPLPADHDDRLLAKGTTWELTVDDHGRIVAFSHFGPHPAIVCATHEPST